MSERLREDLLNIMTRSENVESLCIIDEYLSDAKRRILRDYVQNIAKALDLSCKCSDDFELITFRKDNWKEGVAICLGPENGKTRCSIMTKESSEGKGIELSKLSVFNGQSTEWHPYGFEFILDTWLTHRDCLLGMVRDTLAAERIIPIFKEIIAFVDSRSELRMS
jgi:hypothetical protein